MMLSVKVRKKFFLLTDRKKSWTEGCKAKKMVYQGGNVWNAGPVRIHKQTSVLLWCNKGTAIVKRSNGKSSSAVKPEIKLMKFLPPPLNVCLDGLNRHGSMIGNTAVTFKMLLLCTVNRQSHIAIIFAIRSYKHAILTCDLMFRKTITFNHVQAKNSTKSPRNWSSQRSEKISNATTAKWGHL